MYVVLLRLHKSQLSAKLEKCTFESSSVSYIGFILSKEGVQVDQGKIKAVLQWPEPGSIKDIERFLGLANVYRRFIPRFSEIVLPITSLLKKGTKFEWNKEADTAFRSLKQTFATAPVLIQPDQTLPFVLETDASGGSLGAALLQSGKEGLEHPVA
ncbi:uncharacterized protein [Ambystoma mexicanum]|uniref:uncharacterized protein n=1 Tax=Ambystoma mexicanum TaxID=8296 RepID=UPI0037E77364